MSEQFMGPNPEQEKQAEEIPAVSPPSAEAQAQERAEPARPVSPYSKAAWEQRGQTVARGWQPGQKDAAGAESGKERAQEEIPQWQGWTEKRRRPYPAFIPDKADGVFTIAFWLLGYLFLRWWVILGSGLRMGVFALLYVAVVLGYLRCKQVRLPGASWFWLASLLGCAAGYALWGSERRAGYCWIIQMAFLLAMAVYWVLSATGALAEGRTGNWIAADLFRGFFRMPFGNFGCLFQALRQWVAKLRQGKNLLAVLLGLLLCIPVLGIVLPLLISADKGFAQLIDQMFRELIENLLPIALYALFAIPVACYLFGLASGGVHKRGTDLDLEGMRKSAAGLRVLPMVSVYTLLCVIGVIYLIFMGVQAGYLFSAFAGRCPEGYESYAAYARAGFFELCKVAAFNGIMLLGANCFSKRSCRESGLMRALNVFLSVMTLLLLITAMSKMALYVSAYGLSVRRLLPTWFMLFLGLCFVLIIILQWKAFSIIRAVAALGSAMFVLLCIVDVNGLTASYNLRRYQEGSLTSLSMDFLYDCGMGGAKPALKLYRESQDPDLREELAEYLEEMQWEASRDNREWTTATVQSLWVENALEEFARR